MPGRPISSGKHFGDGFVVSATQPDAFKFNAFHFHHIPLDSSAIAHIESNDCEDECSDVRCRVMKSNPPQRCCQHRVYHLKIEFQ